MRADGSGGQPPAGAGRASRVRVRVSPRRPPQLPGSVQHGELRVRVRGGRGPGAARRLPRPGPRLLAHRDLRVQGE